MSLHPDFTVTANQRATAQMLLVRIDLATGMHFDKPWRIRRAKKLRAGLARALGTNDRKLLARFIGGYRDAIEGECRCLERPEANTAAPERVHREAA